MLRNDNTKVTKPPHFSTSRIHSHHQPPSSSSSFITVHIRYHCYYSPIVTGLYPINRCHDHLQFHHLSTLDPFRVFLVSFLSSNHLLSFFFFFRVSTGSQSFCISFLIRPKLFIYLFFDLEK